MKGAILDIGGTAIKSCVFVNGEMLQLDETPTNAKLGGEHVMAVAEGILTRLKPFDFIGISTTGQVNPVTGTIIFANENVPAYTGMPIKSRFEATFGCKVTVENDVNAAAMGEGYCGGGKHYEDFLCLTYGTGIGGAIVLNKKLCYGMSYSAAEFGHLVTHFDGKPCVCGQKGCYEAYASVTALLREAEKVLGFAVNGKTLFQHINAGHLEAKAVLDRWTDEIVAGLASLIHVFNPPCILLGGGIMNEKAIVDTVREKTLAHVMSSYRKVSIEKAQLGNKAGLYGAYYLAQQK